MSDGYLYPAAQYPTSYAGGVGGPAYPLVYPLADSRCTSLARLAALGAVVGGAVAAASSLARMQRGEVAMNQVVADTAKTAVSSAAATAIAGTAAAAVAEQGAVRLGVMLAAGTAVLYGIERGSGRGGPDLV